MNNAKNLYKAMQRFFRRYARIKNFTALDIFDILAELNNVSNNIFSKNDLWKIYINLYTNY